MAPRWAGMARKKQAARRIEDADAAAHEAVQPYQGTPAVRALAWASEIGDQPQMRALSAALIAGGLLGGNGRLAQAGLRMLLAHEAATAAKNFVKHRVDRTRPRSRDEDGKDHRMKRGDDHSKEETSFPSGHSAGAAAAARAFAREYPELGGAAAGAAAAIALAQIPRCAHYPSDVGAGVAIGLAAEAAVAGAWRAAALLAGDGTRG